MTPLARITLVFLLLSAFQNVAAQEDQNVDSFLISGITKVALGEQDSALYFLNKTLSIEPRNKMGLYWRGMAYEQLGKDTQAFQDFNAAIAVDANYADALLKVGQIMYNRENFEEAISLLTRAIQNDAEEEESFFYRGNSYFGIQKYSDAWNDYSKAIELKEDFAVAYFNRGICAYNLGNQVPACADWAISSIYGWEDGSTFMEKYCKTDE